MPQGTVMNYPRLKIPEAKCFNRILTLISSYPYCEKMKMLINSSEGKHKAEIQNLNKPTRTRLLLIRTTRIHLLE